MFDKSAILQKDHPADADMDFKYIMQDTGAYYIGAKYTYEELMEHELVPFKFKAVAEHYIFKDTDPSTSLESQLYYLKGDEFSARTLMQLKAKVKVSQMVEKKSLFGKKKLAYEEKVYSVKEFYNITLAVKKATGIIVRELIVSKLALMSFSV